MSTDEDFEKLLTSILKSLLKEESLLTNSSEIRRIIKDEQYIYDPIIADKLIQLLDDSKNKSVISNNPVLLQNISSEYKSPIIRTFILGNHTDLLKALRNKEMDKPDFANIGVYTIDKLFLYRLFCAIKNKSELELEVCIKIFVARLNRHYSENDLKLLKQLNELIIRLLINDINFDKHIKYFELFLTEVELKTYAIDLNLSIKKPMFYNIIKYENIYNMTVNGNEKVIIEE
jgi:hypothetical protein